VPRHQRGPGVCGGSAGGSTPSTTPSTTGGVDPRLWSAIVAHRTHQLPVYTFDLGPWLHLLNSAPTEPGSPPRNISVQIFGAAGSNWGLSNTLLLWRQPDAVGSQATSAAADVSAGDITAAAAAAAVAAVHPRDDQNTAATEDRL